MAETTYTYSVATDTANAKVVVGKLKDEIAASTITIAVERVDLTGSDALDVVMKDIMPDDVAGESASLAAAVAAHDGVPAEVINSVVLSEKKNSDGIIQFNATKSFHDSSKSFTTPDYSTRQSWWYDTTAVAGEVMTDSGDQLTFNSTRTPTAGWDHDWINWKKIPNNARQSRPELKVKVYVDDVEQTSGFTVNHATGSVTFDSAQTGVVKADYHYADSSLFELTADAGKKLLVDYVETQFSANCGAMPADSYILFQAIYNGPAVPALGIPANTDIPLKTYEYHSAADFLNESTEAYISEPFMELTNKQMILPWKYLTGHTIKPAGDATTDLSKNEFNKLVCRMVGDVTLATCEIATGTFYCLVEDL